MHRPAAVAVLAVVALTVAPAHGQESQAGQEQKDPGPALAILAGAATTVAGFVVGATVVAANPDSPVRSAAGWLTIEAGFTLAPLAAHGLVGEWGRGAAFSAAPAAMLGGSLALFEYEPLAANHGTRPQERILWALFSGGIFSSAVGVVDAAFAPDRAPGLHVRPTVGAGTVGLSLEGAL